MSDEPYKKMAMVRVMLNWIQSYAADHVVDNLGTARTAAKKAERALLLRFQFEF